MVKFTSANPGIQSRVPFEFQFDDYSCGELMAMGNFFLAEKTVSAAGAVCPVDAADAGPTCTALRTAVVVATECCEDLQECPGLNQNRENGNGRTVRNILEVGYREMAYRVLHTFGPELLEAWNSKSKPRDAAQCAEGSAYRELVARSDAWAGQDARTPRWADLPALEEETRARQLSHTP